MPDENLMATRDDETIRLQRKRARDRNSQRQARERTKKRLASMESLINQMTDRDATGSIAALVQELTEVKEERDRLAKALDDVTKIATSHRALRPSRDNLDYDASTGIEQNACDTSDDINHDWLFNTGSLLSQDEPLGGAFCSDFQQDLGCQTMPEELGLLGSGTGSPGISSFQKAGLNEDSGFCGTTGQSDGDMQQVEHVANSSAPTFDIIVPPSETMCDCNPNEVIPLNHDGYQKSLWRTANETLLKTFELGSDINHTDEEMSDDIPVRAVLEGWDTVLKHWGMAQLPPAWQILRRVDEALFARDSGQVERLAILRILYLRLAFLREPTVARLVKIPPWYHRRYYTKPLPFWPHFFGIQH